MNSLTVGTLTFRNKKVCKEYTRNLLRTILSNNQVKPARIGGDDFRFLTELFKRHPEYERKVGPGIKSIYVTLGLGGGPFVEFTRLDGQSDSISWNRCCEGIPQTERRKRADNYRREVVHDILAYRNSVPTICVKCGSKTNLQVDHCGSTEFRDIVAKFEVCSEDVKALGFRKFHKIYAQYQLLCESCHIMK